MKNMDNKYCKPIANTGRSSRRVSSSTRTVQESPIISWNSEDTSKNNSLHSRNWRWSESPEIELNTKLNEENCNVKETKNKSVSKPLQRKYRSRSRSKPSNMCDKYAKQSNSSNSDHDQNSINPKSRSHRSSHCKSKTTTDKKEDANGNKKHKSKKSKKSKSHRRSTSPNLESHQGKKRTTSKTTVKSCHRQKSPNERKSKNYK